MASEITWFCECEHISVMTQAKIQTSQSLELYCPASDLQTEQSHQCSSCFGAFVELNTLL